MEHSKLMLFFGFIIYIFGMSSLVINYLIKDLSLLLLGMFALMIGLILVNDVVINQKLNEIIENIKK
jgi:hypothetical protein